MIGGPARRTRGPVAGNGLPIKSVYPLTAKARTSKRAVWFSGARPNVITNPERKQAGTRRAHLSPWTTPQGLAQGSRRAPGSQMIDLDLWGEHGLPDVAHSLTDIRVDRGPQRNGIAGDHGGNGMLVIVLDG